MTKARILADYVATGVTAAEFDFLDTTSGTPSATTFLRGDKTWQEAEADVVKISSGSFTNSADIDIVDCFSATYKFYKLFMGGFSSTQDSGGTVYVGFLDDSEPPALMTSNYRNIIEGNYQSSWTGSHSESDWTGVNTIGFHISNGWKNDSLEGQTCEMFFHDPFNNNLTEIVHWVTTSSRRDSSTQGYVTMHYGFGKQETTASKYGLKLRNSATFAAQGHWAVYGYKI